MITETNDDFIKLVRDLHEANEVSHAAIMHAVNGGRKEIKRWGLSETMAIVLGVTLALIVYIYESNRTINDERLARVETRLDEIPRRIPPLWFEQLVKGQLARIEERLVVIDEQIKDLSNRRPD